MTSTPRAQPHLVVVIDDDESVREAVPRLLAHCGYEARAFASGLTFLASPDLNEAGCLILDVAMPDMTGPALQSELERRGHSIPIVYITGHASTSIPHDPDWDGPKHCLLKPFADQALLDAVTRALTSRRS